MKRGGCFSNLPFRVGTTSFIVPATMAANVAYLGARVEDVELLVFDIDEDLPDAAAIAELQRRKEQHRLSYTVHTPLDASLAAVDEARRQLGVDKVRRALAWGRPLDPFAYTVHVYLGDREHDPAPPRDLDAWRQRAAASLGTLASALPSPRQLCVERIDYDFGLIAPVVRALDLAVALDVGHLLRDGQPLAPALDEWLGQSRIIQLHGTRPDGRDHKSLRYAPEREVAALLATLVARAWDGVLTLEVFAEEDLNESLAMVEALLSR